MELDGRIPMAKRTERLVDAAESREKDYVIWDDELPGFGLRVFASGERSYVLQYRALGRSRRYTIGLHGVWTAEGARPEAKVQLGRVAQGDNPAEERQLDHKAISSRSAPTPAIPSTSRSRTGSATTTQTCSMICRSSTVSDVSQSGAAQLGKRPQSGDPLTLTLRVMRAQLVHGCRQPDAPVAWGATLLQTLDLPQSRDEMIHLPVTRIAEHGC
jgi:hypothetical protein